MSHCFSVPVFVFPFSLNPEAEMTSSERPASVPPHCASAFFFSWLIIESYVTPRWFSSFSPLKNMHKRAICSSSTSPGYSYSLTRSWTSSFPCSPLMNHVSLPSSLFDSDTVLTSCVSEGQPSSSCSASLPCISRYPLSAPSVTTTISSHTHKAQISSFL